MLKVALGRIAWVVDLQETANPLYRAWSAVLPDYLDVSAATWALHWAWAAVAYHVMFFTRVNPAAAELYGLSSTAEAIGKTELNLKASRAGVSSAWAG